MSLPLLGSGSGAGQIGAGPGAGTNAAAFLARTTGLDTTHRNAYIDLINGLDTDSLFTKFDVLHVYATQDSTTALLNLISTSFNGTANGSPSFTADRGFTGVTNSTTVYINTGFNPTTGSPNYVQNSAHLSFWSLTNAATAGISIGGFTSGHAAYILNKYVDNNYYNRVNNASEALPDGTAIADCRGHLISNRSSSSAEQGYQNGSSIFTNGATTSASGPNVNYYTLACNVNGTANGDGRQFAMASIGSSLNSTEVANFYNRLRTFMTVVGVP